MTPSQFSSVFSAGCPEKNFTRSEAMGPVRPLVTHDRFLQKQRGLSPQNITETGRILTWKKEEEKKKKSILAFTVKSFWFLC